MVLIKECVSDTGRPFTLSVDAYGQAIDVIKNLGFQSEHDIAIKERRTRDAESLAALRANAPTIEKACDKCGTIFHPTIYQKKPKYCSRACFLTRKEKPVEKDLFN